MISIISRALAWLWGMDAPHPGACPSSVPVPPQPPPPSVVHLRSNPNVSMPRLWTDEVHYDAWGQPYVKSDYLDCRHALTWLHVDGSTSDVGKTQWKHASGPPIIFGHGRAKLMSYGWTPDEARANMARKVN